LTGNLKESIIPYVLRQIRIIQKSNKSKLPNKQPDEESMKNLAKLQRYAESYLKAISESSVSETRGKEETVDDAQSSSRFRDECAAEKETHGDADASLSQPEVESLMPKVINIIFDFLYRFFIFNI
jgi:hypothetical protein